MDKVAEFINTRCYRQALARLCRLASEKDSDDRPKLGKWENHYLRNKHQGAVPECLRYLYALEKTGDTVPKFKIITKPLAWLQALDQFIFDVINRSTPDMLMDALPLDDGNYRSYVLPLYRMSKSGGGKKSTQFENISYWLKHHRVILLEAPQKVFVKEVQKGYRDWLTDCFDEEHTTIAIAHFQDDITPEICYEADQLFVCKSVTDEDTRVDTALQHITDAKKKNAHILVMPELTISPTIRSVIINQLEHLYEEQGESHPMSVPIIILGSFHEKVTGGWCNHSVAVLGRDGTVLFECDKRFPVTFEDPVTSIEAKEGIDCAPTPLTCVVTPIGLMAIAICKDLFDGDPAMTLASLPLDWILVPSMSNSLNPHKTVTRTLFNTKGTIAAIANQEMPGNVRPVFGFFQYDKEPQDCEGEHLAVISIKKEDSNLRI